jgi:hypothetical protein
VNLESGTAQAQVQNKMLLFVGGEMSGEDAHAHV